MVQAYLWRHLYEIRAAHENYRDREDYAVAGKLLDQAINLKWEWLWYRKGHDHWDVPLAKSPGL